MKSLNPRMSGSCNKLWKDFAVIGLGCYSTTFIVLRKSPFSDISIESLDVLLTLAILAIEI
jgi:hypothetical protein